MNKDRAKEILFVTTAILASIMMLSIAPCRSDDNVRESTSLASQQTDNHTLNRNIKFLLDHVPEKDPEIIFKVVNIPWGDSRVRLFLKPAVYINENSEECTRTRL